MKNKAIAAVTIFFAVCIILASNTEKEKSHYSSSRQSYGSYSGSSYVRSSSNVKLPLSQEEADKVRGTGYNGTKPGSVAEHIEIKAAMVKCVSCGRHSDNGVNSRCDSCRRIENKP